MTCERYALALGGLAIAAVTGDDVLQEVVGGDFTLFETTRPSSALAAIKEFARLHRLSGLAGLAHGFHKSLKLNELRSSGHSATICKLFARNDLRKVCAGPGRAGDRRGHRG